MAQNAHTAGVGESSTRLATWYITWLCLKQGFARVGTNSTACKFGRLLAYPRLGALDHCTTNGTKGISWECVIRLTALWFERRLVEGLRKDEDRLR